MPGYKRSVEWVDLTSSSPAPQAKYARVAHPITPPLSSQPTPRSSLNARDYNFDDSAGTELVDLSQVMDEGLGWIKMGVVHGKVVGVRYYHGYATPGEQVMVKREPSNQYDRNAIRIDNVQGAQIGHIPRQLASKLAPYLDQKSLILEGVISGEKGAFDCPILLKLYGPADPHDRAQLESQLRAERVPLKSIGSKAPRKSAKLPDPSNRNGLGFKNSSTYSGLEPSQSTPELSIQDFVQNSERFRPRDVQEIVEAWGVGEEALSKMAMADQPAGLISTLLPYQRQGLKWMLEKENAQLPGVGSKDVVQLWKRSPDRPNVFQNVATNYSTSTPPKLAKGGILADDMGLGKTLQIISLILEGIKGTTLIMAPVSVMSNWVQQIERHVKKETGLKVLTYHGSNRKRMTASEFSEYDVVITSYGTLSTECFPRGAKSAPNIPTSDGLFSMTWARVVLDEGHIIRNAATKASVAASSLVATSRWVLTGTPIVNTIKDLYSMIKFLGITGGLERSELFHAVLTRPLAYGDPDAEVLLQSIMRTFCLRRKKDMKFVDLKLPELSEYVHKITFRKDEREKYDALLAEAKGTVREIQAARGKGGYQVLLEVLLRLRQVCCHWKLTGTRVTDLMAILEKDEVVALNSENRAALQLLLQLSIDSQDECSICLDDLHNPVITACKHVFGRECIERTIQLWHKCPMCRAELRDPNALVEPAPEEVVVVEEKEIDVETQSSKTEALMSILKASRRDPKSKVVIFSQWTSFLNIIERQLDAAGMAHARIDGTMAAPVRDTAMAALDADPHTRILLASLSVCSVGLNLVAADTVILADSWWAPAIEDQAVDRVYRLGQTRPCTVWRLVMEDSIEDRVLQIQAEKRKLVGKAFREKAKGGQEKTTRIGDILKLLA